MAVPQFSLHESGNRRLSEGKYQDAIDDYTKALGNLNPNGPDELRVTLLSNRAQCYIRLGQHLSALHDLDEALRIDIRHQKSLLCLKETMEILHPDRLTSRSIPVSLEELKRIRGCDPKVIADLGYGKHFRKGSVEVANMMATVDQFIFFVRREAILRMDRLVVWEKMNPSDLIVLPIVLVKNPYDFMFFSHCWRTKEHPDPDGVDLKLLQEDLRANGNRGIKFVWVDFCCLPQQPVLELEKQYSERMLWRIPILLRDCRVTWRYVENDLRNRAWIFYEQLVYALFIGKLGYTADSRKYYNLIVDFLDCHMPVADFVRLRNLCTASEGDLNFICSSLSVLLKIRSNFWTSNMVNKMMDHMIIVNNANIRNGDVLMWGVMSVSLGKDSVTLGCPSGVTKEEATINHHLLKCMLVSRDFKIPFYEVYFDGMDRLTRRARLGAFADGLVSLNPSDRDQKVPLIGESVALQFGQAGQREILRMMQADYPNLQRFVSRVWNLK